MLDIIKTFEKIGQLNKDLSMSITQQAETTEMLAGVFSFLSGGLVEISSLADTEEKSNENLFKVAAKLTEDVYVLQKEAVKFKQKDEIIFGINPALSPESMKRMYVPVIEAVCENLGLKGRVLITQNYASLADNLLNGVVDVGWFSPLAYAKAAELGAIVPLASPVVNGSASYVGYIITHKNSKIQQLADLKGKRVAFVDTKSASGYAYPRMILRRAGIDPDRDLGEIVFMGSHNRVIEAVLSNVVAAGATYSEAIDDAKRHQLPIDKLLYLAQTEPIPKDCLAVGPVMSKEMLVKLQQALLDLAFSQRGKERLKGTPISDFVKVMDSDYQIVREVAKASE